MDIRRAIDILNGFVDDDAPSPVIEAMDMLVELRDTYNRLAPTAEQWATHPWATHFMRDMDGWGLWCRGEPRFEGKWRFGRVFQTKVEDEKQIPIGIDPRLLVWKRPS